MARGARSTRRELPPPLPPEVRTVGQLVGEAIRIYGRNPWQSLAIGIPVAVVNALVWGAPGSEQIVVAVAGALLVTVSYVVACSIVTGVSLRSRRSLVAYAIGVLVFVPFPFLAALFILPGPALAVPLRARRSGRAGRGSRRPGGARAGSQVGARGLRPCARRPRDARARRLPHPGIALLRPARVRREHEDRCGDARLDRGVATRASRSGAPVRRPGSSVTLARRATRGARCRRT